MYKPHSLKKHWLEQIRIILALLFFSSLQSVTFRCFILRLVLVYLLNARILHGIWFHYRNKGKET